MKEMIDALEEKSKKIWNSRGFDAEVYNQAIMLISDILSYRDDLTSEIDKIRFVKVALYILRRDLTLRDNDLCDELLLEVIEIEKTIVEPSQLEMEVPVSTLNEAIQYFGFGKVLPYLVTDEIVYTDSMEMFEDFRKYLVKRSNVPKKTRVKVYSYMYYISMKMYELIEKYHIEAQEYDEELLMWMFRTILHTEEFIEAYNSFDVVKKYILK